MSEKQVSFIRLPKKGQEGEKVIKSFQTGLHKSLPNNIEKKGGIYRNKSWFQFPS